MQEEKLTRKGKEKLFRRGEIIAAARDVFAKRGYSTATLDEIAEKSEFGKGTIYNYFENKEALFQAVIEDTFDQFLAIARECCNDSSFQVRECYRAFASKLLGYLMENSALHTLIMREMHKAGQQSFVVARFPELLDLLEKPMHRALLQGEMKQQNVRMLAFMFVTMAFALFHASQMDFCGFHVSEKLIEGSTVSDPQVLAVLLDTIFFKGLLVDHIETIQG